MEFLRTVGCIWGDMLLSVVVALELISVIRSIMGMGVYVIANFSLLVSTSLIFPAIPCKVLYGVESTSHTGRISTLVSVDLRQCLGIH